MSSSPFEINLEDLFLLDEYRIDRLRSFFAQGLSKCVVCVDCFNTLTVYCPENSIVDLLLGKVEELCDCAWLTLGVKAVSIFFVQEEIYHTQFPSDYHLTSKICQSV